MSLQIESFGDVGAAAAKGCAVTHTSAASCALGGNITTATLLQGVMFDLNPGSSPEDPAPLG